MPKPEWGVKRQCGACGVRFYDLARAEIFCPACGERYATAQTMSEKASKVQKATASEKKEEEDVLEADDVETTLAEDSDDEVIDDDDAEVAIEEDDADEDDAVADTVLLDDEEDDADLGEFGGIPSEPKDT